METIAHIETPIPAHETWTMKEVTAYLRVSRERVYTLIREQGLPCDRLGKAYTFDPELVRAWQIKRQAAPPAPTLPDALLDGEAVMKLLGISRTHLHRLMYDQELPLPHIKLGSTLRFDPADIAVWLQRMKERSMRTEQSRGGDTVLASV